MASVWYRKFGKSWTNGRTLVRSNDEMSEVIRSRDKHNGIDMYVTSTNLFPSSWDQSKDACVTSNNSTITAIPTQKNTPEKKTPKKESNVSTPLRRSPRLQPTQPLIDPQTTSNNPSATDFYSQKLKPKKLHWRRQNDAAVTDLQATNGAAQPDGEENEKGKAETTVPCAITGQEKGKEVATNNSIGKRGKGKAAVTAKGKGKQVVSTKEKSRKAGSDKGKGKQVAIGRGQGV
ncbi:hypothetical protein RND81_13G075200 [Saponaria officinalis]|uniref:Uncharacterized protein n=1 Tax=Saponaria officinalis TaxID=3572 RepID=A0AAW1GX34_SAPOF